MSRTTGEKRGPDGANVEKNLTERKGRQKGGKPKKLESVKNGPNC